MEPSNWQTWEVSEDHTWETWEALLGKVEINFADCDDSKAVWEYSVNLLDMLEAKS